MLKPSQIFSNAVFRGAEEAEAVLDGHMPPEKCHHAKFVTTTDGRQNFTHHLHDAHGDGKVTVASRHGRALGAIVPMLAVHYLAVGGHPDIREAMKSDDPVQVVRAMVALEQSDADEAPFVAPLLKDVQPGIAQQMGPEFIRKYGFAPASKPA